MLKTKKLCDLPIKFLQDKLYGICTGDLMIIACDSGCGKSSLSRMVMRKAFECDCPAVLYSLENEPETFATEEVLLNYCQDIGRKIDMREFSMEHTSNPEKFKKYRLMALEKSEKKSKDGLLLSVVHEQVAKGDWTAQKLIQSMKKEIAEGYKLFIIDHLDVLVQKDELNDTKVAMDELWNLVQENNIAVVTFSQIVKGCKALCPSYDDLRGSKAKVYKSTIIITLGKHEYGYYQPPVKYKYAKPTYVRIAKSRTTGIGCAICYFNFGEYLEDYMEVLCDNSGDFIDNMTREKLRVWKREEDKKAGKWNL